MARTLDDYAKELAGLKRQWELAGSDAERSNIHKTAQQLRSRALSQGINLTQLEDSAMRLVGGNVTGQLTPYEQQWRQDVFGAVQSAPTYRPPQSTPQESAPATQTQSYAPIRYNNPYLEQANRLMTQLEHMMRQPVQFNPESDPTYQAAQALAREGAQTAQRQAMETMNERGLLSSSVTTSQLGQIAQRAEMEPLKLIPQLQQQAYAQRQQDIANLMNLMGTQLGAGLDQQRFAAQLPLQEAALTGRYLPLEAQTLIDQILGYKQSYDHPFTTDEQRRQLREQADIARRQLDRLGYDSRLLGSDVTYEEAARNAGQMGLTTDAQRSLVDLLLGIGSQYGSLPEGTGQRIGQFPMFSGIGDYVTGLEGRPTMAQQQFDLTKEKFAFDKETERNRQAIQWANHALNQARHEQQVNYQRYLMEKGISEQRAQRATNGYLSQILAAPSREEAMTYIVENADAIVNDGAHIDSILRSIDAKWPRPRHEDEIEAPSISGLLVP